MAIEMIEKFTQSTQIKVIGVGGGGGNAVEHMIAKGVEGVEFICANTDAQALARSSAHQIIQLGVSGLGAGAKPDVGRAAAEEAHEDIKASLEGANMVFVTAGMGGGTGTGGAPVIARLAKEMGILTVGVVTKPFGFEGKRRMESAVAGLAELEANVDSLIVVLNDRLLDVYGDDMTQDEAFSNANDVLRHAVGGISDIIHNEGVVNVDFQDVRTVMGEQGKALMGTGVASGPNRAVEAAEQAISCPLLEGVDLAGARGVLVLVAGSASKLKLSESRCAMDTIMANAAEDATVIYGCVHDESLGDQLRVTVIITGLSPARAAKAPMTVVHTQVRTGTYDMPAMPMSTGMGLGATAMAAAAPSLASAMAPAASLGASSAASAPTVSSVDIPSVWRGRTAAARVDALQSSGMEELEIPAFLRRQAD